MIVGNGHSAELATAGIVPQIDSAKQFSPGRRMGFSLFVTNGRSNGDDDQETALGVPDQAEATDLNRHVERCAMRYRLFTGRLALQSRDIAQVKIILYGLALFIVATSHPAQQLFSFLANLK